MTSDEGLNAYGAVTWGQFFIYQGFNERTGWMHTSSGVDAIDEYPRDGRRRRATAYFYKYGSEERPVTTSHDRPCRTRRATGMAQQDVHRLPHAARPDRPRAGRQVGQRPPDAGADQGADAVVHAHQGDELQGVPRDDGAAHQLVEQHDLRRRRRQHRLLPRATSSRSATRSSTGRSRWTAAIRPPTGTACCRSTRRRTCSIRRAAGSTTRTTGRGRPPAPSSPKQADFPAYVDNGTRVGARPARDSVLSRTRRTSRSTALIAAAYDSYLPSFEKPMPALLKAWDDDAGDRSAQGEARRADRAAARVGPALGARRRCRRRSPCSGAKTCSAAWARRRARRACPPTSTSAAQGAGRAAAAVARGGVRQADRGFRHLEDAVGRHQPLPAAHRRHRPAVQRRAARASRSASPRRVGLARLVRRARLPGHEEVVRHERQQLRRGRRVRRQVRAQAVTAGGESGDPTSPHFNDEAERYATGNLREVYFYPAQLKGHTERTYHPGS